MFEKVSDTEEKGNQRDVFSASHLSAILDGLDDQHFIATSLELIRDRLNINVEVVAGKVILHKNKMGR